MNNFSVHLWQRSATSQVGYLCKYCKYFFTIIFILFTSGNNKAGSRMDIGLQGRCFEGLNDVRKSDYCFKPAFNPLSLEGRELERG
jgi:hypothetical protein